MAEEDVRKSQSALYQRLGRDDIHHLKEMFNGGQRFSMKELENILEHFGIRFSPDRLKTLFLQVHYVQYLKSPQP